MFDLLVRLWRWLTLGSLPAAALPPAVVSGPYRTPARTGAPIVGRALKMFKEGPCDTCGYNNCGQCGVSYHPCEHCGKHKRLHEGDLCPERQ